MRHVVQVVYVVSVERPGAPACTCRRRRQSSWPNGVLATVVVVSSFLQTRIHSPQPLEHAFPCMYVVHGPPWSCPCPEAVSGPVCSCPESERLDSTRRRHFEVQIGIGSAPTGDLQPLVEAWLHNRGSYHTFHPTTPRRTFPDSCSIAMMTFVPQKGPLCFFLVVAAASAEKLLSSFS